MRLIDADHLRHSMFEKTNRVQTGATLESCMFDYSLAQAVNDLLDLEPTIDPVRHSKWIEASVGDDIFFKCALCGFLSEACAAPILYKFCPNCGAKMDGGEDD